MRAVKAQMSLPIQAVSSESLLLAYIEDIQIFVMNMPFISSSEAKNAYFMSGNEMK